MNGLSELAAAARARNEAYLAEKNMDFIEKATGPLKERIAELEGLLEEAVKRGDALAAELEQGKAALADSKAHVESLQSQLKAFEEQAAKPKPQKIAPKKGK